MNFKDEDNTVCVYRQRKFYRYIWNRFNENVATFYGYMQSMHLKRCGIRFYDQDPTISLRKHLIEIEEELTLIKNSQECMFTGKARLRS